MAPPRWAWPLSKVHRGALGLDYFAATFAAGSEGGEVRAVVVCR